MESDSPKPLYRITLRYLALQGAYAAIVVAAFIVFRISDQASRPFGLSLEVAFVITVTLTLAIAEVAMFTRRHWFDPSAVIYGPSVVGASASNGVAFRNYTLISLFFCVVFAYLSSLAVPECAVDGACIDFSESSILLLMAKSVVPMVVLSALGKSVGNAVGCAIAWMRS